MSLLTDIGLVAVGFLLGLLLVSSSIIAKVKTRQMVLIYPSELRHFDAVFGVVDNRGKLLWKHSKFKIPDKAGDVNIDLDKWR